ncbi:hypothetical protein NC651_035375 [Populus alba x Populus x berolinensis]|nr:hypothetical protein NC651_035375 [Populus alba x Populus x berolinensis]
MRAVRAKSCSSHNLARYRPRRIQSHLSSTNHGNALRADTTLIGPEETAGLKAVESGGCHGFSFSKVSSPVSAWGRASTGRLKGLETAIASHLRHLTDLYLAI